MRKLLLYIFILFISFGCKQNYNIDLTLDEIPAIYPDYKDVTVPYNIAPLNFKIDGVESGFVDLMANGESHFFDISNGQVSFDISRWRRILKENKGKTLNIKVVEYKDGKSCAYQKFDVFVSGDDIDPYIAYRLLDPGYELWNNMGIYQRNLQNFEQTAIFKNSLSNQNCVNCHSFNSYNPEMMLFHMRSSNSGTYIIDNGEMRRIIFDAKDKITSLVYPYWHPSGKYIAFSSNNTRQAFHVNDPNKIEVYDLISNIVVYDRQRNRLITSSDLYSEDCFQTFPTFSPDGNWLYYCVAKAKEMPRAYRDVHYNICRIGFDQNSGMFKNEVDTIFNSDNLKSSSFPRISPDGKYLLFTKFDYGNFSIWHKEADLEMIDLVNKKYINLDAWNSNDTESYHSWSSNGKWVVFSSRRDDGLYTKLYIGHIDQDGNVAKPFLLPQKDNSVYMESLKSFNIPEFVNKKVDLDTYKLLNNSIETIPENL